MIPTARWPSEFPAPWPGSPWPIRKYGSRPWAELIDPAVRLAEQGFPVSASLHKEMVESREYFLKYPSSTRFFLKNDGTVYETGELWKQPDLADTLKRIQKNGEAEFYNGKTAELIIAAIRQYGGIMTMEDLKNYRAIERRAYRDRALYLGDPEFNSDIPKDRLISKAYAAELRKAIDPQRASKSDELTTIDEQSEKMETTHFSVVDGRGNAVSLTYTLNGDFGAYLVPAGSGVVLNNSLSDFNNKVKPGGFGRANLPAPGKRPLSSMTPTIIAKNGKPHWVIGSPGGQTIISTKRNCSSVPPTRASPMA